jgi:putative ABC transport system permease protein
VKLLLLTVKNMRRNLIRSTLTALGTMVLVFVFTLIWSVLSFLDAVTAEKTENLKAIVSERWQIASQMPYAYAPTLAEGAARNPADVHPADSMTWSFYGGTIDKEKRTRENTFFAFAMAPEKLATMMDDLELKSLPAKDAAEMRRIIDLMKQKRNGTIVGWEKLKQMHKRVGDRFTVNSFNYKDIDLELEVLGQFPDGRYNQTSVINCDYLNAALDAYPQSHNGKKHDLADKALNLVWLRVPDTEAFSRVQDQIMKSPLYTQPAVKCETAASGIASFLESYRDLIWMMRWLLAPAILLTLSLVIANAISISVRERRREFAVLRVLGFRPRHILVLVVGEAVALGGFAGLASAGGTYYVIDHVFGGFNFPIAFFGAFFIPAAAILWGLGAGVATALLGSVVPAWSASGIQVTEALSKVA